MYRWQFVVMGMVIAVATVGTAQSAEPSPATFLGVANESGYRGTLFQDEVAQALATALNATQVFVVKDAGAEVKLPLDAKALIETGKALRVPAVLQAVVKNVGLNKPKRGELKATVTLEAVLASVKSPHLFFKARAQGSGENAAEGRAVAQAVQAAATEIARQLSTAVRLRGQVLLPPAYEVLPATTYKERDRVIDRAVRISLDMISGLPVGAEVVILKGGKPVAAGRVVEVDLGSSLVALTQVQPNAHIHSGDEVRVTFLPQHPIKLPLPLEKEREYKRIEHDFAWALLIAGIAVAFVGE